MARAGRVRRAGLVVTGEGRLDRQSAFGKTTVGVAGLAREAGKPVVALVGSIESDYAEEASRLFDAVFALTPDQASPGEAISRAADLLSAAAEEAGRWLRDSGGSGG